MAKSIYRVDQMPLVMDVEYVALVLGCSVVTVRKLIRTGQLPGKKLVKEWRVTKKDLLEFIDTPESFNTNGRPKTINFAANT